MKSGIKKFVRSEVKDNIDLDLLLKECLSFLEEKGELENFKKLTFSAISDIEFAKKAYNFNSIDVNFMRWVVDGTPYSSMGIPFISCGFVWRDSKEGPEYWGDLQIELSKRLDNDKRFCK